MIRRDGESSLHGSAQGTVRDEDAAGIFGGLLRKGPGTRSVGTGSQLGAPRRDDIRDARFQRQLGVPPQVAGVDHVRVEVVDFAIEPQPPGIAVAGRLIFAE